MIFEDEYKNLIFVSGFIIVLLSGLSVPIMDIILNLLLGSVLVLSLGVILNFVYNIMVKIILWAILFILVMLIVKYDRKGEEREWHIKAYGGAAGLAFGPILAMNVLIPIFQYLRTTMALQYGDIINFSVLTDLNTPLGLFYQNILLAPMVAIMVGFPMFALFQALVIQDVYEIDVLKALFLVIPIVFLAYILAGPAFDFPLSFILEVLPLG